MNALANALLDSRRAADWLGPNERTPRGDESIGDAETQGQLRSDNGQVGTLPRRQLEEGAGIGEIGGKGAADRRNPGVPRSAQYFAPIAIGPQPRDEGVLSRPAAENENSHDRRGLQRRQEMHDGGGLFR